MGGRAPSDRAYGVARRLFEGLSLSDGAWPDLARWVEHVETQGDDPRPRARDRIREAREKATRSVAGFLLTALRSELGEAQTYGGDSPDLEAEHEGADGSCAWCRGTGEVAVLALYREFCARVIEGSEHERHQQPHVLAVCDCQG